MRSWKQRQLHYPRRAYAARVLKLSVILTEFLVVLYADHVRFHPCHPYNYRESTDSLIEENVVLRCKAIRGMNH